MHLVRGPNHKFVFNSFWNLLRFHSAFCLSLPIIYDLLHKKGNPQVLVSALVLGSVMADLSICHLKPGQIVQFFCFIFFYSICVCVCWTIITVNLHAACVNRPLAICNYGASCAWLYFILLHFYLCDFALWFFLILFFFVCSASTSYVYMVYQCIGMQIMLSSWIYNLMKTLCRHNWSQQHAMLP